VGLAHSTYHAPSTRLSPHSFWLFASSQWYRNTIYDCPAPVGVIRQHKENDLKCRGDSIADQRYPLDEFYKQRPEAEQLKLTRAVNAKTPSGNDARGIEMERERHA
jgi:hypothetical protein